MAILPILTIPNPTLRIKVDSIEKADESIQRLMDDMLETMYHDGGVGLAAPQVGVTKRILVMDLQDKTPYPEVFKMANPEIIWVSDESVLMAEGCLSIPEGRAELLRPAEVKVRFLDYYNERQERHLTGWEARCVQHEIDHLNGVLFIDHLSRLKREIITKKILKR